MSCLSNGVYVVKKVRISLKTQRILLKVFSYKQRNFNLPITSCFVDVQQYRMTVSTVEKRTPVATKFSCSVENVIVV